MKQDCLFITVILSLIVFCSYFVFGQEIVADVPPVVSLPETIPADAAVTTTDTVKGAVRVERLPQDVVVLVDNETGRRMYTLPNSWTPEFIDSISRYIMRDQRSTEPTFVIHEVDAVGTVEGNKAKVVFKFRMTTRNEPIIRVPLGIKEGVVLLPDNAVENNTSGQSSYMEASGEGEIDLVVDTNQGEYVALIRHSERQLAAVTDNNNTNNVSAPLVNRPRRELPCELKLTLWFPIATVGKDEYRLNISFPKTVRSQFQLTVPETNAVPSVSTGTILLAQTPENKDETANAQNVTTFNMRGLKSDFYVSWQPRKTVQIEETTVLSVEDASLLVRLNEDRIDYEVMLPVRCHTGMLDRFRVKLPPGVQLIQDESATTLSRSYVISRVAPTDNAAETGTANVTNKNAPASKEVLVPPPNEIEVRLLDKNSTTLNLPLRAVKTIQSENPNDLQEDLVGFEVVGADKQSGFLSIEIPADRQLVWRTIRGITRSEPSEVLSSRPNETQFSFFAQPFLLRVQAKKPQTQISVRPEYVVFINKDRIELTAMFQYTIHGSRAEKLQIYMHGWNNPEVTPYSIIDITNIQRDGGGDDILTIPLLDYTESSFALTLTATLQMSPDLLANHRIPLRFELPTPIADSRSVASVAIVAADCIQLFPRDPLPPKVSAPDNAFSTATASANPVEEETVEPENVSVGLSRSVRRSHQFHIDIPQLQQAPLFYQKTAPVSAFSADVLYHKQQVKVANASEIQLLEPRDQVTQTLRYTILYERLDNLYLYVPKKMNDEIQWRVFLDSNFDKPLTTYTVPIESDSSYSNDYVKKRIALDRIGSCQLTIRYGVEQIDTERDFSLQVSFPFVIPANIGDENTGKNNTANAADKTGDDTEIESRVYQQTVSVVAKKGFELTLNNRQPSSSWEADPNQRYIQGGPQHYQFGSTQSESEIRLLVSQAGRDVLGTTVIERAWIQSQLSSSARADCVTCQLTSNRDSIMLHVPTLVTKEQLLVRINDAVVMPQLFPSGELVVPLAAEHQGIPLVMEVWYTMPFDNSSLPCKLDLPYFDSSVMVRCIYWQLLVPRNIHLLSVPNGWTPEYQWNWEGLFWGRYPSIDQQEIGLRSGSTQPLRLPVDTNRYLFSTLERRNEGTLYLFNRGTLVLLGSGLSLLVGLILIYVPKSRYAGSLLALAITTAALVLYRPTPFLLLLQASILGVMLALAVAYFDRLVRRQDRWMPYTDKPSSVASKREQHANGFVAAEDEESNDDGRDIENE
ncbi:MAG: hypothetical protein LBU65_04045 [Planctomycetaceae bacterium]|jgi:hypothetical protein|nr:hypothetical protein [Planctomycetaceae bacterium]